MRDKKLLNALIAFPPVVVFKMQATKNSRKNLIFQPKVSFQAGLKNSDNNKRISVAELIKNSLNNVSNLAFLLIKLIRTKQADFILSPICPYRRWLGNLE